MSAKNEPFTKLDVIFYVWGQPELTSTGPRYEGSGKTWKREKINEGRERFNESDFCIGTWCETRDSHVPLLDALLVCLDAVHFEQCLINIAATQVDVNRGHL